MVEQLEAGQVWLHFGRPRLLLSRRRWWVVMDLVDGVTWECVTINDPRGRVRLA